MRSRPAAAHPVQERGRSGLGHRHHRCRNGGHRQVATHLKTEVIAFQTKLLDVAFTQSIQQLVKLIVIELHAQLFSRPR